MPSAAELTPGARPAAEDARDQRPRPLGGATRADSPGARVAAQSAGTGLPSAGAADRLPGSAEEGGGSGEDA